VKRRRRRRRRRRSAGPTSTGLGRLYAAERRDSMC
jgi:hypothetical protein